MNKSNQSLARQLMSAGLWAVFLITGCSERVVTHSVTDPRSPVRKQFADSRTDTRERRDPLGILLLSQPASETSLDSFSSAVESPRAKKYRFSIEDGKYSDCSKLGELKSISELMTLQVGKEGPKTICLQAADESGQLGKISRVSFKKISDQDEFPEALISGAPSDYTAKSEAVMSVITPSATEYRASFISVNDPQAKCKTLETNPWKETRSPISLKFSYDGPWLLCVEVRDSSGRKSVAPKAYRWIRDTVYPVVDAPELPTQPTTQSEYNLTVSGNLVDNYQYALVEGKSNCVGVSYSALAPVATPLNLRIPKDGTWSFCLQTENKSGLKQQVPYIHMITKVSPIQNTGIDTQQQPPSGDVTPSDLNPVSKVILNPVQVNSSLVPLSDSRTFTISGTNVTHYKATSFDSNSTCPVTPPATAAVEVSKPLTIIFTRAIYPFSYDNTQDLQNIRTLCVWGVRRTGENSETVQATATWFRFYNSTGHSMTGKDVVNAVPMTIRSAKATCSCHEFNSPYDWERRSVSVSWWLRRNLMPASGWVNRGEDKAALMAFLSTISGYPVDLPYVIGNQ
jgi:hypothetical protein